MPRMCLYAATADKWNGWTLSARTTRDENSGRQFFFPRAGSGRSFAFSSPLAFGLCSAVMSAIMCSKLHLLNEMLSLSRPPPPRRLKGRRPRIKRCLERQSRTQALTDAKLKRFDGIIDQPTKTKHYGSMWATSLALICSISKLSPMNLALARKFRKVP